MLKPLERLTPAAVLACLLAASAPAQMRVAPDGAFLMNVESAVQGFKAPITAQKVVARRVTPVTTAIELVKQDLRRTYAKHPRAQVVPESYIEEIFDGRYVMLYPNIPKIYEARRKQREKYEALQKLSPDGKAPPNYPEYRKKFITAKSIAKGVAFVQTHRALLDAVEARYDVDPSLLVALASQETRYGADVGSYRVFDALYTIILKVPEEKWIKFAVHQEAEFIRMVYGQKMSVHAAHAVLGTYDGGMGYVQFEPASFNAYAVDFDRDGKTRLNEWPDALGSAANYLVEAGYDSSEDFTPDSAIGRALFRYNNSTNYVRCVLDMRNEIHRRLPAAKKKTSRPRAPR